VSDWRADAACVGYDTNDFYPADIRQLADQRRVTRALAACGRCPVRSACLADALATDDRYGIRGGLTEDDRRRFRLPAPRSGADCVGCGKQMTTQATDSADAAAAGLVRHAAKGRCTRCYYLEWRAGEDDLVVVERAAKGEFTRALTKAERVRVIEWAIGDGGSNTGISRMLRVAERTVAQVRAQLASQPAEVC